MKKRLTAIPVVILKTESGYNAFSPVVDGCVATARTVDGALKRIKEALEFHLVGERLVKNRRKRACAVLRDAFDDYGTDAVYASIDIVSG
jgi:predicted RNase H-like HicB family nuclease